MTTLTPITPASTQPTATRHPLTPAQRTAQLLAYKPGFSHNFTLAKVAHVPVAYARGAMATS